jgi:hypothetical protein
MGSSVPEVVATDFTDTTPPHVTIEEVTGVNPDLNVVLFKIQAEDNANAVSLRDCNAGAVSPNCEAGGNYTFLSQSQIPPPNVAPVCTAENLTRRLVVGGLLASNSQSTPANSTYKQSSLFYIAITKTAFEKVPDGCPQWRSDSLQTFIKDRRFSIPTVIDQAGNATEVPIWTAFQKVSTLPTSTLGMCFIGGDALGMSRALTNLSNNFERFTSRFEANSQFSAITKNTSLEKYEDQLRNSKQYARFYQDSFEPDKMNALPVCKKHLFANIFDLAILNTNIANEIAVLSIRLTEFAENESQMRAEAKARQEAEAKTALELKAKQEAEAKAKAAALRKTTITCVKGKLTKKVTAVKPKCPAGYKKKA